MDEKRVMAELDEVARIISEAEQATSAGDHAAAERALRLALKLQEAHLGLVHSDVANTLNDLGVVCDILGRPDEAEFLYRRALGIARRTLAADHPYIATSLQNLSNLYRAQGKPEKLAKLADGLFQRSGLPEIDSTDESGAETVAPEMMAHPETPAVPAQVTRSQSGAPPPSGSRPLYARVAQPAILLTGTGVVLLSLLWLLLFDGNTGPDGPGQDGAGIEAPLQVTAGEQDMVGTDPARGSASSELEPVPNADRVSTPADSGRADRAAPSSEDRTAGVTEPSSARLPAAVANEVGAATSAPATSRSATRAVPAVDASSVVVDAEVCSGLVTRGADGTPLAEWRCQPIVDHVAPGQLFFYTRIRSRTNTTVEHRWFRDGALDQEVDLDVGANTGAGYRTYSVRTVSPREQGAWRVELRSMDRELLYVEEFVVR